MIKIYTEKSWHSLFGKVPVIIIENDYIYSEKSYYSLIRKPIGKIDRRTGRIFGEDYAGMFPVPIGCLKTKGDVQELYGEDFANMGARPLVYIKNNKVYSYREYYKLISSPGGFLERG